MVVIVPATRSAERVRQIVVSGRVLGDSLDTALGSGHSARVSRLVDGGVVLAELSVPDSDDSIVLLDPDQRPEGVLPRHPFFNLLRDAANGDVVWRAPMVETTTKSWVSAGYEGGILFADAWSWRCRLDQETGRIVSKVLTK